MVLSNYFKIKTFFDTHYFQRDGSSTSDHNNWTEDLGALSLDGTSVQPLWNGYPTNYETELLYNWAHRMNLEIRFGSGNTAVTASDYALDTPITDFTNLSYTINSSSVSGGESTIITCSGTNPTASAITITEFGIVKKIWCRQLPNWVSHWDYILYVREVLQSPITAQPNENFQLAFEWLEM
jgi:hypothetical protein